MSNKVTVFGIKNCNSMTKAFNFLQANGIEYEFIDYKKEPFNEDTLKDIFAKCDNHTVINKKGMMWKKLTDEEKLLIDSNPQKIVQKFPSIIKRPFIQIDEDTKKKYLIGLDEMNIFFGR